MKQKTRLKEWSVNCIVLVGVLVLCISLMTNDAASQTPLSYQLHTRWIVPSVDTADVQGIDVANTTQAGSYDVWLTDRQGRIGQMDVRTGYPATARMWRPVDSVIHPFKIVKGCWDLYGKMRDLPVGTMNDFPVYVSQKDVMKLFPYLMKSQDIPTFTIPDQSKIGMLVPKANGVGRQFWLWSYGGHLGISRDIQRRSPSDLETSAWVSKGSPYAYIYQFIPKEKKIREWRFANPAGELFYMDVFYVVPGDPKGRYTEIWMAGDSRNPSVPTNDVIGYMKANMKDGVASFTWWKLPGPATRTHTSIVFTSIPTSKGYTKPQVWVTSSTAPQVTLLEPVSFYTRGRQKDRYCVINNDEYKAANGVYWPGPAPGKAAAADNSRRIWIPDDQAGDIFPAHLYAGKAAAVDTISSYYRGTGNMEASYDMTYEVIDAELSSAIIPPDTNQVSPTESTVACDNHRYTWPYPGFSADFTGADLDIDMGGSATGPASNNAFFYDIFYHEPNQGRIGMMSVNSSTSSPLPGGTGPILGPEYTFEDEMPTEYGLNQNYPNPFNPLTIISYSLVDPSMVTLKVYNTLGQEVATLLNNQLVEEGKQEIKFDASQLTSGVYFYRLLATPIVTEVDEDEEGQTSSVQKQTFVSVKKMLLLK